MNNKYIIATMLAAIMVLSVVAFVPAAMAGQGNNVPNGPHYNLNLIGVKNLDQISNDGNNGHRIFVKLDGRSDIYLQPSPEGESFAVIDTDATDRDGGKFQLPPPENNYDDEGKYIGLGDEYRVYIRVLGQPGKTGILSTCGEDTETVGEVTTKIRICSLDNLSLVSHGKKGFEDVTKELTTVEYFDADKGRIVTVDIFSDAFQDYLWQFDNNGIKIVQLRFYEI